MQTFAVHYVYDGRDQAREALRPAHRSYLHDLRSAGVLLASGPFTGPTTPPADQATDPGGDPTGGADEPPGALLLMRGSTLADVLAALDGDPFWTEGLVTGRTARRWDPVIGPWAD